MSYKTEIRKVNPSFNFGPWYDHYIRPFGKCHADFDTHVIGDDPRGVKVCIRRENHFTVPQTTNGVRGAQPYATLSQVGLAAAQTSDANVGNYVNSGAMYAGAQAMPSSVPDDRFSIERRYVKIGIPFDGTGVGTYNRYGVRK